MWILAKAAGLWRSLSPAVKGFVVGIAAGLLLSAAFSHFGQDSARKERIARQNVQAALDSTRKILAHHDTVFARLLVQKDVELSGALRTVASQRHYNAKLSAKLALRSAERHTTESHTQPGDLAGGAVGNDPPVSVSDSLHLAGPPVEGTVGVTVTAQPDTTVRFAWDARLRPSPIDLSVGVGCGKDGPELIANGPPYLSVGIDKGEIDPKVCNPLPSVGPVGKGLQVVGAAAVILGIVEGVIHLVP